jgi:rhodanese-related sulfurtransferase
MIKTNSSISKMLWLAASFLFSTVMNAQETDNYSIPKLLEKYNKESVNYIQVNALHNNYRDFIILDTRKRKEYDVSHLPDAIWAGDDLDLEKLPKIKKNQKIVVYCSVGIRSEGFGEQLREAGFTQVYNLYGSIFSWKDAGFEVVNVDGKPTDSVHVYSRKWGNYLKTGKKVY